MIHVETSGDLSRSALLLELYHADRLAGTLTIRPLSETEFLYESDCSAPWVETYLWETWGSMLPTEP